MSVSYDDDERSVTTPLVGDKPAAPKAPITLVLLITTFACLLPPFMFGYQMGYMSPAMCAMKKNIFDVADCQATNTGDINLFSSIHFAGAVPGALLGGPLMSRLGPKFGVIISSLPYILGALMLGFSAGVPGAKPQGIPVLANLARVFTGIALGLTTSTVPVYLAEISPAHLRGTFGTGFQFSIVIGFLVVYSLYSLDWTTLSFVGIVPPFMSCVLMLIFAPESVTHLVNNGRGEEAKKAIKRLRGPTYDWTYEVNAIKANSEEPEETNVHTNVDGSVEKKQNSKGAKKSFLAELRGMCTREFLMPMTIGVVLMIQQQMSGINAVLTFSQSILESATCDEDGKCVFSPELGTVIVGAMNVVGTVLSAFIVDRLGRKVLLIASAVGMVVSLITLGVAFYLGTSNNPHCNTLNSTNQCSSTMAVVAMLSYVLSFALGMGPIPWVIVAEVFQSKHRSVGQGISAFTNWAAGFIVVYIFDTLVHSAGRDVTFWIFSGCAFSVIVFTALVVPETKGKSLEELSRLFTPKKPTYSAI